MDDIIHDKKHHIFWFVDMKFRRYVRFEEYPEYQILFKKTEAQVHRQRAEVIEYLKEEGDWDPAWGAELGLD
jgi:hypothetical protein